MPEQAADRRPQDMKNAQARRAGRRVREGPHNVASLGGGP
jgi:hypothetical protein